MSRGFEVVIKLIFLRSLGIRLQDLVKPLLPPILADDIGLPAPNYHIEYPVEDDNDESAKGQIVHLITQYNGQSVVDQCHNDAKIIDEVGCAYPSGLKRSSTKEIDDEYHWYDQNNIIDHQVLGSCKVEQEIHDSVGTQGHQLLLPPAVLVVQHLSVGGHLVAFECEGGNRENNEDDADELEDEHGDIE
jgi:hypothetical protein